VSIVTLALLIVVLMFEAKKGSHRWIDLGLFEPQPSEFAKLAVIMFTAHYLAEIKKGVITSLSGCLFLWFAFR
jgi:cell division protein FtsW